MRPLTLVEWVAKYVGTRYLEIDTLTHEACAGMPAPFRRMEPTQSMLTIVGAVQGLDFLVSTSVELSLETEAYAEFMTILEIRHETRY
jgi:hypothetical protein